MSASIIFIGIFICFSFYGIFSSFNRLVKANISLLISFIITALLYCFDKFLNNGEILLALTDLHIRIYPSYLRSLESFVALLYFLFFSITYIITRLILHGVMVGINPSFKPLSVKVFHVVFIFTFLCQLFFILTLIVPYAKDYFEIPSGFMEKYFNYFYGWML